MLTFEEYQMAAQRTSNTAFPMDKVDNGVLGLSGESGEVADLVKKFKYQGHPLNIDEMIGELGDVLWYVAETATGLGVCLQEVAQKNIEKLKERYPDGFEAERSIHRDSSENDG